MCKETMELYSAFRAVPAEAKKPISAGRLAGKTDINPMWRIKVLTEKFGPCGFGWKTRIVRTWLDGGANDVVAANVEIELYIKYNGEWSEPIPGIGGAAFIASESKGLYTDDDAYKKAYTDAISVACKALGIAADVYFEKDPDSKYQGRDEGNAPPPQPKQPMTFEVAKEIRLVSADEYNGMTLTEICKKDLAYFNTLGNHESPVIREAAAVIVDYIKNAKKEKKENV